MFDVYLDSTKGDGKRRAILTFATVLVVIGTAIAIAAMWVAGKMQIAKVSPPTTDFVLVQFSVDEAPPPPPPPPPPAGDMEEEVEEEEEVPEEDEPIEEGVDLRGGESHLPSPIRTVR